MPESQIFILSSVQICAPGFYCLINFFLLFFNKDTRHVWKKWCKVFSICCPGKKTDKDETDLPNVSGSLMKNEEQTRSSTLETNVIWIFWINSHLTTTQQLLQTPLEKIYFTNWIFLNDQHRIYVIFSYSLFGLSDFAIKILRTKQKGTMGY